MNSGELTSSWMAKNLAHLVIKRLPTDFLRVQKGRIFVWRTFDSGKKFPVR
jgi:hypothetical protein